VTNINVFPIPVRSELSAEHSDSPARRLLTAFLAGRYERTLRAYRQGLEDFRAFVQATTLEEAAGMLLARIPGLVPWSLEGENGKAARYRDTRGPGHHGSHCLLDEVAARKNEQALRDRAALRLRYDLGLRRGEVVGLDLEDVDAAAGTLAILGKGRNQKELLSLPDPTKAALMAGLEVRGTAPGPLFTTFDWAATGNRLTGTSLSRMVRDLGRRAGLTVRPQGLRQTAIMGGRVGVVS
jgi:integrase/recombinase XerC